jgi:AcrR family transcriptional regulator
MDQPRPQTPSAPHPDPLRRLRLQAATADAVAERGYDATTIDEIIKRAGVSHRSFRSQFASKEQCFLAAFDAFAQQVYARIVSSYRRAACDSTTSTESLHSAIETLMQIVATRQAHSRLCLVEARSAGRFGIDHCESAESYFAHLLTTALPSVEGDPTINPDTAIAIVGGIWHVAYAHLTTDSSDRLPALSGQIVTWILTYTGHLFCHFTGNGHPPPRAGSTFSAHCSSRPAATDGVALRIPEPLMPRPETKREEILRSLASTVRTRGYRGSTIREVARRAGISTTTFYRYFPSKDQAILDACDQWTQHVMRLATESCARADTPAGGIRDAIASFVRCIHDDLDMAHLVMVDSLELGSHARAFHDRTILGLADLCTSAFDVSLTDEVTLQATSGAAWSRLRSYAVRLDARPQPDPTAALAFIALAPFIGLDAAASHAHGGCSAPEHPGA